jgi:Uma2 family endonuclease
MVVVGSPDDYTDHPTPADVRLVVEVSDTTLRLDRKVKAALYAEAGVPDYWIGNLRVRRLEVYRDPVPLPDPPGGYGYRSVTFYSEEESITPIAAPHAVIRVADLLPPVQPDREPEKENTVGEE